MCRRIIVGLCLLSWALIIPPAQAQDAPAFRLAIHGGAGTIQRANMTPEREAAYRAALQEALETGHAVLASGGSSMDAVIATIAVMEESPLFNAGKGAVFTSDKTVELDASVMDGQTRAAGAVAGVTRVKSPIALARLVMEASPHVMMVGTGAEQFGTEHGIDMVDNAYFHTERRLQQLEQRQARDDTPSGGDGAAEPVDEPAEAPLDKKWGTVGAVALDQNGNLAAGTSTGGMTNKRYGRVGDAPIIGAGTYADNATAAVSATGHGEYFIRGVVAYDIAAMMRYGGLALDEAANAVVMGRLSALGGTGGVIAMDREGHVAMPFNTSGMYRGVIDADGTVTISIYRDE
ncbi:MAG: isoaspartyl peptidase/L-asparaginase [Bacteroidota bacterium]